MQKRAITSVIQHNLIQGPRQGQAAEVALKLKKAFINRKEGDKTFSKAFNSIVVPCVNRKRFKMKQPN